MDLVLLKDLVWLKGSGLVEIVQNRTFEWIRFRIVFFLIIK